VGSDPSASKKLALISNKTSLLVKTALTSVAVILLWGRQVWTMSSAVDQSGLGIFDPCGIHEQHADLPWPLSFSLMPDQEESVRGFFQMLAFPEFNSTAQA
jgi:hypothetical protein